MPQWGKSCIKGGGDEICSAFALQKHGSVQDNSYVQYKLLSLNKSQSHHANEEWVHTVHYGQLQLILECVIIPNNLLPACQHLLAVVTCVLEGIDGAISSASYLVTLSIQVPSIKIADLNAEGENEGRSVGRFKQDHHQAVPWFFS
ncbi:uncharacterized protein EI90DRAFT_3129480 [Cantharellus anzutake]|uniref:uncharacterized protein n=1 Tax=Cantharellus anzutake TaxID=1750568 RepID=UPI00190636C6|nr:uncharacterized protein EI90DRAFT_3129480 [Cantharellus anzutake]KAF8324748.1 hypothetical protein EI90DRAFT_3129480 [Cantharellus anzutake]